MNITRREFGKMTLAGLVPLTGRAKIDPRVHGVTIGAITYSFRAIPGADDIVKAYVTMGIGEMELMSNHAEALAGAPRGGRGQANEPLIAWRKAASDATFKPVRETIRNAGIDLRLLCYNMNVRTT